MARVRLGRFPSSEGQLGRIALEQLSALQGVIASSEVMVELWVEPDQLHFRFSEKSGELAELIISTDAGVVRKQVLTTEGWKDQPQLRLRITHCR